MGLLSPTPESGKGECHAVKGKSTLLRIRGLRKRWIFSSVGPILLILVLVSVILALSLASGYYNSARTTLKTKASVGADYFNTYLMDTYSDYYYSATRYAASFDSAERIELQFLDSSGHIETSTRGLNAGTAPGTPEIRRALETGKTDIYEGRDPATGEKILAVSCPLNFAGTTVGVMRYVTATHLIDRQIVITTLIIAAMAAVVTVVLLASNLSLINGVVTPVAVVTDAAKRISGGSYGIQIPNKYSDEMGELVDNINDMSLKISQSEKMQTEFISSVSHELRTPLTAITGWGETLLADESGDMDQLRRGVRIILNESRRLTNMVEELLDFARIESGRMKLEIETFDMSIELYEAVYMYENLLKKSGIRLLYDEDVDANYYINGDRHRMKQVFLNILDNAAKYGGDGKQIDIDLKRDGGNIVVSVRDYGQGIPEAELPFVKEKFYKGSSKQRGSGIGLAVTEEIVSMHGGTLDIASEVGKGTTVTVTMPSAKSEEALGITGAIPKASETPFTEGEHS